MKPSLPKNTYKELILAFSDWGLSWGGLIDNRQGEWWLIGQILLISAHLLPKWPHPDIVEFSWPMGLTLLGICLIFIGIVVAGRAFLYLGPNLSPLPNPKPSANLVTRGSYRSCRHPLYQGLLISSYGIVISLGSIIHLLLSISLTLLLVSKAKREEQILQKKYFEYSNYKKTTPAIIKGVPFLDWRN